MLNPKIEIFIIGGTLVKSTFFETLGILACKKKCAQNFSEKYFFNALQLNLIW